MKKYILLLLSIISFASFSQTVPTLPSGAKPYGNQLYIVPSTGLIYGGNAGYYYRVLGTKQYIDSLTSAQFVAFNNASVPFNSPPIVNTSVDGFDTDMGEQGNIFFDDVAGRYLMTYSGRGATNRETNVFIGLATSIDGITWTKYGKIINTPSEDPYMVKKNGIYYLYVEKKDDLAPTLHAGIELFTSDNPYSGWVSQGVVLDKTIAESWESGDVSSPLVFIKDNTWYMYYEGRGHIEGSGSIIGQGGAIGLATSSNGISWTRYSSVPLVSASQSNGMIKWGQYIVPDDIFQVENRYFMTCHVYNGVVFAGGLLVSDDLLTWKDYLGTWINIDDGTGTDRSGDGMMVYKVNNLGYAAHVKSGKIYAANLNIKPGNGWVYSSRTSASTVNKILNGSKNEIISAPITGNVTFTLGNDSSSTSGTNKVINNISAFTLTITPEAGVTINGSTSSVIVSSNNTLWLSSSGTNAWRTILNAPSSAATSSYIQNQTASPQSAGFNITGAGTLAKLTASSASDASIISSRVSGSAIKMEGGGSAAFLKTTTNHDLYIGSNNVDGKITIKAGGNVLINTVTDNSSGAVFQVNGFTTATQYRLSALNTAPSSATATGVLGEIRVTAGFIYVCTATNTWVRAALTTFFIIPFWIRRRRKSTFNEIAA